MKLDFDVDKLQAVADDFYNATGIGIFIIGKDFSDVKVKSTRWNPYCGAIRSTECGRGRCVASDNELFKMCSQSKKPEKHICHGGLMNIAAPIMYDDVIVGYVFFFALRQGEFDEVAKGIYDLSISKTELAELYYRVPIYNEAKFKSIINLAVMLAQHVIFSKMIKPSSDENIQTVKSYIKENLNKDLSVKSISRGTNISKSVLYRLLNRHFGCTISEYVNKKRIEEAIRLLVSTELSVSEIAEQVGFSSAVYFRTTFKKLTGNTPLKYRKAEWQKESAAEKG